MARWGIVAAVAAALACGDGEGIAEGAQCSPQSCATRGATCGTVDDGCGNLLECGTCPAGQSCGGGGAPNTCGASSCQPATCQSKAAACGLIADDCGGTVACGDCPAGQVCGGGGTPNACGPPPGCQRATCAAKGATCGTLPDGCGGELACGECRDGEACGAGGQPNVCAPVPATGSVGWSHVTGTAGPDFAVGAGSDRDGNRYLLTFTVDEVGGNDGLRLEKLSRDGQGLWSRDWIVRGFFSWGRHFHLLVAPDASLYLAVSFECFSDDGCGRSVDLGGGLATDSVLVKLKADGTFDWQRALTGTNVPSAAVNSQGAVLVARTSRGTISSSIDELRHDGTLLATVPTSATAVALDPSGNMIVAEHGVLRMYSSSGLPLWSKDLSGGAFPYAVATAADGTIVVLAARGGDVSFGPSTVRSGLLVLYVLEPDARPRFARGLPWSGQPSLAVDPSGRAAVTGTGSCSELVVEAFDLSNQDLWRRVLPDDARCWAGMGPGPAAYGADHRLFVTGAFTQSVEIGGTLHAPRGTDAIGVLLDP